MFTNMFKIPIFQDPIICPVFGAQSLFIPYFQATVVERRNRDKVNIL